VKITKMSGTTPAGERASDYDFSGPVTEVRAPREVAQTEVSGPLRVALYPSARTGFTSAWRGYECILATHVGYTAVMSIGNEVFKVTGVDDAEVSAYLDSLVELEAPSVIEAGPAPFEPQRIIVTYNDDTAAMDCVLHVVVGEGGPRFLRGTPSLNEAARRLTERLPHWTANHHFVVTPPGCDRPLPVHGPSVELAMRRAVAGLYCPPNAFVCEARFINPAKAALARQHGWVPITHADSIVFSCSGLERADQPRRHFPEYKPGMAFEELERHAEAIDMDLGRDYAAIVSSFDPAVTKRAAHYTSAPPGSTAYSIPTTSLVGQNSTSLVVPSATTLGTLVYSIGGYDPTVARTEFLYAPSWNAGDTCRAAMSLCVPACLDGTFATVNPMSCEQCIDVSSSLLQAAHAGHHYVATAPPSSGAFTGVADIQRIAQGDRRINYGVPASVQQSLFYGAWVTQSTPAYSTVARQNGTNAGIVNPLNGTPWWPLALTSASAGASTATTGNFAFANLPTTSVFDLTATGLATTGNTMFNPALPATWNGGTTVSITDTSLMAAGAVNDVGVDRYTIAAPLGAVRVNVDLTLQWPTGVITQNSAANSAGGLAYLTLTFATATQAGVVTERTLQVPLSVAWMNSNIINTTACATTLNFRGSFTGYLTARILRAQISYTQNVNSNLGMGAQPIFAGGIRVETLNPWGAQANVLLTNVVGPATLTQTFRVVGRAAVCPDRIASMQDHISVPEWTFKIPVINAHYVRAVCQNLKITFYRAWGSSSGELEEHLAKFPSTGTFGEPISLSQYHRLLTHAYAGGFWDTLLGYARKAANFVVPLLGNIPGPVGTIARAVGSLLPNRVEEERGEASGSPAPQSRRRRRGGQGGLDAFPSYPQPAHTPGRASGVFRLAASDSYREPPAPLAPRRVMIDVSETYEQFMLRMRSNPLRPNDRELVSLSYSPIGEDDHVFATLRPADPVRAAVNSNVCHGDWPPAGSYRYIHAPIDSVGPDSMQAVQLRGFAQGTPRGFSCPFPVVREYDGRPDGAEMCELTFLPGSVARDGHAVSGTGIVINSTDPEVVFAVQSGVRLLETIGLSDLKGTLRIESRDIPVDQISGSSLGAAALITMSGHSSREPWTGCVTTRDMNTLQFPAATLRTKLTVCTGPLNVLSDELTGEEVSRVSPRLQVVTPTVLLRQLRATVESTLSATRHTDDAVRAGHVVRAYAAGKRSVTAAARAAGLNAGQLEELKVRMQHAQSAVAAARRDGKQRDRIPDLVEAARVATSTYQSARNEALQEKTVTLEQLHELRTRTPGVLGRREVAAALNSLALAKRAVERAFFALSAADGDEPAAPEASGSGDKKSKRRPKKGGKTGKKGGKSAAPQGTKPSSSQPRPGAAGSSA